MDINCTYDCLYQSDGKCRLTSTPKNLSYNSIFEGALYDGDCPYRQGSGVSVQGLEFSV